MNEALLIDYRKARLGDLEAIFSFERSYILEHEPNQIDQWDMAKTRMIDLLTQNIHRMFVAVRNTELVGHSYWSIYEEKPCIFSIYVIKKERRQGIARVLLEKCEGSVLESGFNQVTLSTLEANGAQYMFEEMGYERVGMAEGWIQYEKFLS